MEIDLSISPHLGESARTAMQHSHPNNTFASIKMSKNSLKSLFIFKKQRKSFNNSLFDVLTGPKKLFFTFYFMGLGKKHKHDKYL